MKKICVLPLVLYVSISFSQTRYLIPYRKGNLWGYADTNLNIVVTPKYDDASPFSDGYAVVKKGKMIGVLDGTGQETVPLIYDTYTSYPPYKFLIVEKNRKHGIINLLTGQIVLPVKYRSLVEINEFIYIAEEENSLKGVINLRTGKWLLPVEYNDISFEDSLYIARKKNKSFYFTISSKDSLTILSRKVIPKKVKKFIPRELTLSEPEIDTSNGKPIGSFEINSKMGYSRNTIKNGIVATDSVPAIFEDMRSVKNNDELLIVKKDGKAGVITKNNKETVPLIYDEVEDMDSSSSHGIYIVKINGKYGLSRGNKLLLDCNYDVIFEATYGFELIQNKRRGAYIYSAYYGLFNILIPVRYNRILGMISVQVNDFYPPGSYVENNEKVKFILKIRDNTKTGYVDLNGVEFFKN